MKLMALLLAIAVSVSVHAQSWTPIQSMSAARRDHGAATGPDGKIYVVGGWQVGCSAKMERYDPLTNTWETMPPMSIARCNPAVVMGVDGYIYVIGGFAGAISLVEVERFDTKKKTWETVAPLNKARARFAAAVGPDLRLYVFGGATTALIDSIEVFDGKQWMQVGKNLSRTDVGLTGIDGNVHTFGEDTTGVWARFDGVQWMPQAPLQPPGDASTRFSGTAGPDGLMYLFGVGVQAPNSGSGAVAVYAPFGPVPTSVPPITPRTSPGAAAAAEGRLFVIGGRAAAADMKSGESFGPLPAPILPDTTALFRFDGSVKDSFGAAAAAAVGSPKHLPGRIGQALYFNGSGQYVTVADGPAVDFGSGEMSIEGWIRWQPVGNLNKVTTLIDKRTYSGGKYQGYAVFFYKGRLGVQLANGSTYVNYGGSIDIEADRWTHIAVTRSGTLLSIYVNSVLDRTWVPLAGSTSNSKPLFVGRHSFYANYYRGYVDELTFYDRALRWAEIRAIFLAGREGKQ